MTPTASGPIAVPDPVGGLPGHAVGEPVTIGDSVVTFEGINERGGSLYLTFKTQGSALDGAQLLVGESVVELARASDGYEAGPIDAAAIESAPDGVVTLVVDQHLIPFLLPPAD